MTTRRAVFLPGSLEPDNSGSCYAKPSIVTDANDLFPRELIALKDSGTPGAFILNWVVPDNFVASPKGYLRWRSSATSGNARFTLAYRSIAVSGSTDPSAVEETLTAVDSATDATGKDLNETDLGAITTANLTAGEQVQLKVTRNSDHANDTLTGVDVEIEAFIFQYSDA